MPIATRSGETAHVAAAEIERQVCPVGRKCAFVLRLIARGVQDTKGDAEQSSDKGASAVVASFALKPEAITQSRICLALWAWLWETQHSLCFGGGMLFARLLAIRFLEDVLLPAPLGGPGRWHLADRAPTTLPRRPEHLRRRSVASLQEGAQ
jgi:hypothetical protein